MLRQVDLLGQRHLALLQWAAEIDLFQLIAEIDMLVQYRDQAIFDSQENVGPFLDRFVQGPFSFDEKGFATSDEKSVKTNPSDFSSQSAIIPWGLTVEEGWVSGQHSESARCNLMGRRSMLEDYSPSQVVQVVQL